MNVHAWIEWDLPKVNVDEQAVFVLRRINSNNVGVSVKVGVGKATED